jgi:hypothetical protein
MSIPVYSIIRLSAKVIEGGMLLQTEICGTSFRISKEHLVTAAHVLHPKTMRPASGFQSFSYWLYLNGTPLFAIQPHQIKPLHNLDASLIFYTHNDDNSFIPAESKEPEPASKVFCYGYNKSRPLSLEELSMVHGEYSPGELLLEHCYIKCSGIAAGVLPETINTRSISMENVRCIETTICGIEGLSGAPLLNEHNQWIGMISFGRNTGACPDGSLCAICSSEILTRIPSPKKICYF